MEIFTALATTCIQVGEKIFTTPLERRLSPERRKARYLLHLYKTLRDCHDAYAEWKSAKEKLREFTTFQNSEKDEDIGEEENRSLGRWALQEYFASHPSNDRRSTVAAVKLVDEEYDARIRWGHAINHLYETLQEGRSFLEIHNKSLAEALFSYSENEDDGYDDAELKLDCDDLRKSVPTGDFEHAHSLLADFVKKHTTLEDFF
jgi:hypothetical protein